MNTLPHSVQDSKTPTRILENTRKYRQTPKGLLTNLYQKMKSRNREHGFPPPSFSKEELHKRFLTDDKFVHLFHLWITSQDKRLKPSVDRIDPCKPYAMDNIQILTHRENREKGDKEKEILWGKPVQQLDMDGNLLAVYPSAKAAIKDTGVHQGNLSQVLHGKRNYVGGYKWEFAK